jgi:drug/metabolite transporter (DMT)-like permease
MADHDDMKIFAFVLVAAILEASGDAILRLAPHHQSLPSRVGLFLFGSVLLALYGTSLNLAPVDFATVTGVYVATVFVVFQLNSYLFFHQIPSPPIYVGGALIISGAMVIMLWK